MNTEIEAKFANTDHDIIRAKLQSLDAMLEQPMRLMRRVVVHTPDMTEKNAFIRVRDEGHRATMTYKQFDSDLVDGAKEHEVEVGNFEETINILSAAGLKHDTYQETKRENWRLGDVEIMLDEWPWLNPYVEIEGESQKAIAHVAKLLGFEWSQALFGGVANIYKKQYPHIGETGVWTINQEWPTIKFGDPAPSLLETF